MGTGRTPEFVRKPRLIKYLERVCERHGAVFATRPPPPLIRLWRS